GSGKGIAPADAEIPGTEVIAALSAHADSGECPYIPPHPDRDLRSGLLQRLWAYGSCELLVRICSTIGQQFPTLPIPGNLLSRAAIEVAPQTHCRGRRAQRNRTCVRCRPRSHSLLTRIEVSSRPIGDGICRARLHVERFHPPQVLISAHGSPHLVLS